jgi:hypothetical protein
MTLKEAMQIVYGELTFRVNFIETNGAINIYKKHDEELYACCFFNGDDSSASGTYLTLAEAKNWNPL